jgi:hypothetical protein
MIYHDVSWWETGHGTPVFHFHLHENHLHESHLFESHLFLYV